jgi:hypothetical protein
LELVAGTNARRSLRRKYRLARLSHPCIFEATCFEWYFAFAQNLVAGLKNCNEASSERVKGIEPSPEAWEASVLPLNYTREVPALSRETRWLQGSVQKVPTILCHTIICESVAHTCRTLVRSTTVFSTAWLQNIRNSRRSTYVKVVDN